MFERFTDRARRVIVLAQEEARMLGHNYIGTEHILLGVIHEGRGVSGAALDTLGVTLDGAREQVASIVSPGQDPPSGHIPFTPRAKTVLELSLREALNLGHSNIGPEDVLLGLIREGQGVASQVLLNLGVSGDRAWETVLGLLRERGEDAAGRESQSGGSEGRAVRETAPGGGSEARAVRDTAPGGESKARAVRETIAGTPPVRLVILPAELEDIAARLDRIDGRLAAIERHLGIAAQPGAASFEQGETEPAEPESPGEPEPPGESGPAGEAGPAAGPAAG
jgi:ATP-dependent Clp protease ATP-binding subunit ClpA